MNFKRLFQIKYNNKYFDIFIDSYNRKTFLEVVNNKYKYPLFEDFVVLNKIYNQKDLFVFNEERLRRHQERNINYYFKEFVRLSIGNYALLLSVLYGISLVTGVIDGRIIKLKIDKNKVNLDVQFLEGTIVNHISELDDILGYKDISIEEVINTINMNENIPEEYKKYAIDLVNFIHNKYPETDMRIYYENMKNMIIRVSNQENMGEHIAGTYNCYSNVTSIRDDHADSRQVVTHEFAHSYHHWKEDDSTFPKYRVDTCGYSLDEAMTNRVIDGLVKTTTYTREGKILNYFLKCVDYSYYDYEREGVSKLISMLQEKYPLLDINYLIQSIDAMKETQFSLGEYTNLEDNLHILDIFFEMCKSNVNFKRNDIYKPMIDFLTLINYTDYNEVAQMYFEEYNDFLTENGIDRNDLRTEVVDLVNINSFSSVSLNYASGFYNANEDGIDKDNLYSLFFDALDGCRYASVELFSSDKTLEFYYDMLDVYNDYLFRNGYAKKDVITREEVENKYSRFNGIIIIGYCIDNNDVLHPIVDIPKNDKVFNTESRIASLDIDGRLILLEKDNMRLIESDSEKNYHFNFLNTLFSNIDKDNIVFDEEFWQDMFKLYSSQYKKVELLYNGEKIGEDYLFDLMVNIGNRSDGSNTFSLYNEENIILDGGESVISDSMKFTDYLGDIPFKDIYMSSIELADYLCFDYLRESVGGSNLNHTSSFLFDTLSYDMEKDIVYVHPAYTVKIDGYAYDTTMNNVVIDIGPGYADIFIDYYVNSAKSYVSYEGENFYSISLYDVLKYYNLLTDSLEYEYSYEEVLELFGRYVNDVYSNDMKNSR